MMGHMKDLDRRIRQGGDDAIAAACELLPRWISVEDRLPKEDVDVLVSWGTPESELLIAHWRADEHEWFDDQGKRVPAVGVTHWMPLPEPPEVKTP